MQRFEGKVALVTGAASGIGKASALRLAREGARVLCTDVQTEALEQTAKEIESEGGESEPLRCDVGDPGQASASVERCVERFGALDVLCNIAGILHFDNTHELSLETWDRILRVNLTGTFLMCQAALGPLLEARGNIVNISSTAALAGHPWTAAYSASKGGVLALTRTLAVEYGKQGLRVNAICPGSIQTDIQRAFRFPDGVDQKLLHRIMPFDEMRPPEVVANAVAFLGSHEAVHINGTELRVDSGTLA